MIFTPVEEENQCSDDIIIFRLASSVRRTKEGKSKDKKTKIVIKRKAEVQGMTKTQQKTHVRENCEEQIKRRDII